MVKYDDLGISGCVPLILRVQEEVDVAADRSPVQPSLSIVQTAMPFLKLGPWSVSYEEEEKESKCRCDIEEEE
jgi:hypothetical protein